MRVSYQEALNKTLERIVELEETVEQLAEIGKNMLPVLQRHDRRLQELEEELGMPQP